MIGLYLEFVSLSTAMYSKYVCMYVCFPPMYAPFFAQGTQSKFYISPRQSPSQKLHRAKPSPLNSAIQPPIFVSSLFYGATRQKSKVLLKGRQEMWKAVLKQEPERASEPSMKCLYLCLLLALCKRIRKFGVEGNFFFFSAFSYFNGATKQKPSRQVTAEDYISD